MVSPQNGAILTLFLFRINLGWFDPIRNFILAAPNWKKFPKYPKVTSSGSLMITCRFNFTKMGLRLGIPLPVLGARFTRFCLLTTRRFWTSNLSIFNIGHLADTGKLCLSNLFFRILNFSWTCELTSEFRFFCICIIFISLLIGSIKVMNFAPNIDPHVVGIWNFKLCNFENSKLACFCRLFANIFHHLNFGLEKWIFENSWQSIHEDLPRVWE